MHADLLGEATLACSTCRAHVEFVDDHLKQVELFVSKIAQQLLIGVVLSVQLRVTIWALCVVLLFIDLIKEAIASIMKLDDLLRLQALDVVFVVSLLPRMVTLVEHVGVVHSLPAAEHFDLVQLLLLLSGLACTIAITKKHISLVLLVLLELGQLFLLGLNKNLLEDHLVLLLSFRWEGPVRLTCLLGVCIADSV